MRKYWLNVLALIVCCGATAQSQNFGAVPDNQLSLAVCPFDKDADAIVLLHEAVSTYDDGYRLLTEHHVRVKILKEKGIDEANISIPFRSQDDFETIGDIKAITINTDANGMQTNQDVERKSIFRQRNNAYWSEMKFTFPSVKVGSILEYKYTSTCRNYGGLDEWVFQSHLPVLKSRYQLYIVPHAEFSYAVRKSSSMPVDIKKNEQGGSVVFTMENIPGLKQEPYMDARRDYLQRVEFQLAGYIGAFDKKKYMTSWAEVIRELNNSPELAGQLNKNLDGTEDFIKLAKQLPPLERMDAVYNFVRKNMSWNGINSRLSPGGIKSAWNKKSAVSGDINLILINLLKAADLEVYPMLVSERHHGRVDTNTPFVDQFNTIYAAVVINGKKYYLDATNQFIPPRMIPPEILNTTALILNRRVGGLIRIADDSLSYREYINVMAKVNEDGNVSGKAFFNSTDYARCHRLREYKKDRQQYIKGLSKGPSAITIDSFSIMNETGDSLPLQNNFLYKGNLNKTGDYIFVPLNLFSGFTDNPFVADHRLTDINFGFRQSVGINCNISLPEGYAIDALPQSVRLVNPDKTILFTRRLFRDEAHNVVVAMMSIDLNRSFYAADDYAELKEFYKKMFDMLNEPIVLRKK